MKTSRARILSSLIVIAFLCLIGSGICRISAEKRAQKNMVSECEIPISGEKVRLYMTQGSSVTTSDSYRVTFQAPRKNEVKIYSAYSSPAIKSIACEDTSVIFTFYPDNSVSIPVSWIKEKLVHTPLTFYKLKLTSPEYQEEVSHWEGFNP